MVLEYVAVPFLILGKLGEFLSSKPAAIPGPLPLVVEAAPVTVLPVTEKYVVQTPSGFPAVSPQIAEPLKTAIEREGKYTVVYAPSTEAGKLTPLVYETMRGGGGMKKGYEMI